MLKNSPTLFRTLVGILAFCAGFSIMAFELLGGRILAPYFGSSVYVWGSIITIFMLALAIGYLTGGKFSLNNHSLTRFSSLFMLSGVLVIPTIFYAEPVMEFIFSRVEDPRYGSLLAASALFFCPTVIMGMIAPYSVRLMTDSAQRSGQSAGFLYFVSTIGSALGTIMTSFYFVAWFEINTILWMVVAIMTSAGTVALVSSRTAVHIDKEAIA